MSFKPEVLVQGTWSKNGLVFETRQEAEDNAHALMCRWLLVMDSRAVESEDTVNYRWIDGKLVPV